MASPIKQQDPIEGIQSNLAKIVQDELGENVYLCYQCVKCSGGCPVAEYMDLKPNQVMRAIQLGQSELVFHANTTWLCAACQTCNTRCPQGLDIPAIMEFMTRKAISEGITPPEPEVKIFNEAFMRQVSIWGRAYEPGLMIEMKLRQPEHLLDDIDYYVDMLKKGKVSILPKYIRPPKKVKTVPHLENEVAYYPGCSLESTATEYDHSAKLVAEALGLKFVEPPKWICCGSSAAHRKDPEEAVRLPMQNLALVEQSGFDEVTMPCAACFNRHKYALYEWRHNDALRGPLAHAVQYEFQDKVKVNSLLETIYVRNGVEKIKSHTKKQLAGLKLVCYYGCLLTRPPAVTEARHPENPQLMDELLAATGADVLDWSYKTVCCGASHAVTKPEVVLKLSGNIVQHAQEVGADAIAVACPLCHMNLDGRQKQMKLEQTTPIFYFTQLLGLALGFSPAQVALNKHIINPESLLKERQIL